MNKSKPLQRIFDGKGIIPFKLTNVDNILTRYKFSDFQKSEMIQSQIIEDGVLFRCTAVERDGFLIILKQEIIDIKSNQQIRIGTPKHIRDKYEALL